MPGMTRPATPQPKEDALLGSPARPLCSPPGLGHLGAFTAAIVLSEVLIGPLKDSYDRTRPPGSLVATTGASFRPGTPSPPPSPSSRPPSP
jgi:hypothetical protein